VEECAVLFQEGMHFHTSLEAQQSPNLRLGDLLCAVSFQGKRFQGRGRWVLSLRNDLSGKLVRDVEGDSDSPRMLPAQNAGIFPVPCIGHMVP
jgi:hypothetical protein